MADEKRWVPHIGPQDRAEQLLIEYQDTPNPQMMAFAYQETEDGWFCACGTEHSFEEKFCGHCGISRDWLIDHSNDFYLAREIMERKGEDRVKWVAEEPEEDLAVDSAETWPEEADLPIADPMEAYKDFYDQGLIRPQRVMVKVPTRLADYRGRSLKGVFQYFFVFAPAKRRALASLGLALFFVALAILMLKI